MQREFVNELDNKISMSVTRTPGTMMAVGRATIKIVGPKSTSENIITQMEARILHEMLSQMFRRAL
jgi:hypothetical protein